MSDTHVKTLMDDLPPARIVEKLNEYIIGQDDAKKAVAIAIRNRWRRQQIDPEMRNEVTPKNIIMIGPTGVGKTEIARRLADMTGAPFLKVEASKYTEVGYHGRDVESMIRDIAKAGIAQVQAEAMQRVAASARDAAEERVLDFLLPRPDADYETDEGKQAAERYTRTREKLRAQLRAGGFADKKIEIEVNAPPPMSGIFGAVGSDEMAMEMQEMLGKMMPGKRKSRRITVPEALAMFQQEEAEKLLDDDSIQREGIERAEQGGIIFIDEIDKVIGSHRGDGPDVSREGVQRDLLPIVEGATVVTKYGPVKTDHILFIAAGAFHGRKPSDLIPELQGRFPIRVELNPLSRDDFKRILTHPKNALTKQYRLLMATEGVDLEFAPDALDAMAEFAANLNQSTQDIGARRLHTIMEKLLEDVSFNAPDLRGKHIVITGDTVRGRLEGIAGNEDLSKYIL
ncbi:MAG: ATP-dependent protease ATPase subunit HslU [Planctomycetaceae bacterium]|nr:ATP-dependent protease ATPase subunit HslU [Planctomycetaceae bacterium]